MIRKHAVLFVFAVIIAISAFGQQADSIKQPLPSKYLTQVSTRSDKLEQKLDKKSDKALQQLQRQESKIKRKLGKTDSLKASTIFGNAEAQYASLKQRLQSGILAKSYISTIDTLSTSLRFLQQNPQLLSGAKGAQEKLKDAVSKVNGLEGQLQKAEEIKKFLKERRQYLKEQLGNLGFAKELKKVNKNAYYYSEQINEYKELLKDHTKAEKKAIALLSKTKFFKDFMRKNSQLASLFRLPGDPNDPTTQASLAGLQTRAQVSGLIQQQLAAGGPNAQAQFQQNMQQAQSQLNQLKTKLTKLGKSSSNDEMPEGFRPNNQKTKSFLKRLQLGTNIQSQRANGYFPTTSDLGISLGYKLNDKSIIGIGGSYKMGWGKDIRHINITHQGIGIRSFIDWKIKGSFWISGGYELNYCAAFKKIDALKDFTVWQQSGLIGVSKVISLKTKFFKQTKLQLLWDFLSYQQIPHSQPIIVRIGYNF